jgi:diguanylate cyclase (GGDEF)-like protein
MGVSGAQPRPVDELLLQRRRRAQQQVPQQREDQVDLSEPDREAYELRLDAYEVQLAEYRQRLEDYASQLDAAHHDGLTGAWLRQAGQQLLDEEIQRSDRLATPLTIAFVDLDGLKALNDRNGHGVGDRALATVARALIAGLRGYDHVIRWGGDEFLCVVPGLAQPEAVRRIATAREAIAGHGLSISVGIAERRCGEDVASLVHRADLALYESRGRGLRRR